MKTRSYSGDKDLARFIRRLVAAGWTFHRGGKHNRLIAPSGAVLVVPATPSDRRCLLNVKTAVRRVEQ